jgi:hypothetical protein
MDDAAGKVLVRADLFGPAQEIIRIAREHQTISAHDASEIEALAKAASGEGFRGQKAGARLVGSIKNLLLAAMLLAAAELVPTARAKSVSIPILVRRIFASLASGQTQIKTIAMSMPDDLRYALRVLVEEARRFSTDPSPTSTLSYTRTRPRSTYIRGRPLTRRGAGAQ